MTTQTIKNPYVRLTPDKLNVLSELIVDNIEDIFDNFNVKCRKGNKFYYGPCPIHDGDGSTNPFNLYYDGVAYKGNWKCRSHGCERTFKKTSIGFIRGVLSKSDYGWRSPGDNMAPFNETINWLLDFLKTDKNGLKVNQPKVEKRRFINSINWTVQQEKQNSLFIKRDEYKLIKTLRFSSAYLTKRGFGPEIQDAYFSAECIDMTKPMGNRLVIPVFDDTGKYIVGVTGRSLFDKCETCGGYHQPESCPPDNYMLQYKKWRHNKGFSAEDNLFNFWNAKDWINRLHSVILVESPFNVFRLVQSGVYNVVGTFGTFLNDNQLNKLFQTELYTVNLLYDNDLAGKQAMIDIETKINRIFNVNKIVLPDEFNDVAEMEVQQVQEIIVPQVKNH